MPEIPKSYSARRPERAPKPEKRRAHNSTLAAGKGLSPVGKNEARREAVDGVQCEACRMLPCSLCGAPPPSDPAHTPPRSHGGLDQDAIPACRRCHDELDAGRHSRFWRSKHVDPETLKEGVREWMQAGYPQGQMPFGR